MKIFVGDIKSYVDDNMVIPIIRDVCRARPKNFQFMKKYKQGFWDGYISLMLGFREFPTGLLTPVRSALMENGYPVQTVYISKYVDYNNVKPDILHDVILRDYQVDVANKLLSAHRGVAKMATNAGKTEVISAIIKSLNLKTIIIVHTVELLHQTAKRIQSRTGMNVGIFGDGVKTIEDVTVCMIQTLHNHVDEGIFHGNRVIIVDECHHVSSAQMMDALYKLPGSYRYGFSGTPLKSDVLSDLKLMSVTGDVLCDISNDYLIHNGYSAKPVIQVHVIESSDQDEWELKYQDAYDRLIVHNDHRNKLIADISQMYSNKTVLVLVTRIEHGNILENMIPGSVFVSGSDTTEKRQMALDRMRKGDPCVTIASTIFDEGVDVPGVDHVILASGGESSIKLLQRIGRGLRKKSGRNELVVHDFLDDTNEYLLNHSEDRIQVYVNEGFEKVLVK